MKMVKSLILGSAAGLVAMSGAQAADLPVKAKAVEYVRICSLYGAGFYYIPGTDTCIKLGGYLRADVVFNSNSDDSGNISGAGGAQNRFTNGYHARAPVKTSTSIRAPRPSMAWSAPTSMHLQLDARTPSQAVGNGASVYSLNPGTTNGAAANNANTGAVAGGTVGVYYAFIQFAGFTIGKAISQFSAPFVNYPGNIFDGLVGGGGTVTGVNQLTYTAQFGNGVSATISAQDQTAYYQAGVQNLSARRLLSSAPVPQASAPSVPVTTRMRRLPISSARCRSTRPGARSRVRSRRMTTMRRTIGGTELTGHPDDKWGCAVQGALSIKTPEMGVGDVLNIQGVYTDGATRYNIQDLAAAAWCELPYMAAQAWREPTRALDLALLLTRCSRRPAVVTQQQLIQTWGMSGGFTHNWDPYWNSSIYGA